MKATIFGLLLALMLVDSAPAASIFAVSNLSWTLGRLA